MRVVDEDIEFFLKKHNLKILEKKCTNCSCKITLNRPFYCYGYAYLKADICECGHQNKIMVFSPVSKKKKEMWNNFEQDIFN